MIIKEISEDEFNSYNIQRGPSAMLAQEVSWFSDEKASLLGTILVDKIDKDWNYIILAKDSDRIYRFAMGDVSFESYLDCENKLRETILGILVEGKFSEKLFEQDNNEPTKERSDALVCDIDDEVKRYFKKHPEKLYEISPRKFEELIASVLEDFGFDVELTKATRDGGRDIIARVRNSVIDVLTYVECKRYAADKKIGVGVVREVIGVHYTRKPSKSVIFTTSFFTKDAVIEAKKLENQLELKDIEKIKELLRNY